MNIRLFLTSTALLLFCLLAACGEGTAECKESCETNDDCQTGLVCVDTTRLGQVCAPELCETCLNRGQVCYTQDQTDEDGNLTCYSPECREF